MARRGKVGRGTTTLEWPTSGEDASKGKSGNLRTRATAADVLASAQVAPTVYCGDKLDEEARKAWLNDRMRAASLSTTVASLKESARTDARRVQGVYD
ncbi:hypothetical protein PF004_g25939 [Phytophthora fragariae]|uniref:Uncharacterized protein n=1 Tax=Phytophthora fragariae TaxID=53985 RepID=A0A6G0MPU3_9STRA|nr:hypothetical protein PF004_g25939 [Phytophthora fragariae]